MKLGRRGARSLAFQTLFEMESRPGRSIDDALQTRVAETEEQTGRTVPPSGLEFARRLVQGTLHERETIDARIHEAAPAFPVEQLPSTDRVVLELCVFDLLFAHTASDPIVINEAVELAKTYGGENSGRFVNGVLGTIAEGLAEGGVAACP